jgi:hypothetical protein
MYVWLSDQSQLIKCRRHVIKLGLDQFLGDAVTSQTLAIAMADRES